MAWIIGMANKKEIEKIEQAGYHIDALTDEQEKALFGATRVEDNGESQEDKMIMLYVYCDIPDLLDFSGV